jgi:hypothetical protein
MVRKLAAALLGLLALVSHAGAQQWATKMFATTTHDFGSVARNAKAEFEFVLTNIYLEDVHVASARASCGCTSVRIENPLLKTYEKGAIVATFNTKTFLGHRGATITVTLDQPFYARVRLRVQGYIRGDVLLDPSEVTLGTVDQGTGAQKTISVIYQGRSDWRILEVKSVNPHLSGEVANTTRNRDRVSCNVRIRLDSSAPAGVIKEHLLLVTNDRQSRGIPVLVEGQVVSGVTVRPESLYMGVVRPGEEVTKQLLVEGKRAFRITSVTSEGDCLRISPTTSEGPKPLHVIRVTFAAGDRSGKVVQTIRIQTDAGEVAEVKAFAVVQP